MKKKETMKDNEKSVKHATATGEEEERHKWECGTDCGSRKRNHRVAERAIHHRKKKGTKVGVNGNPEERPG